MQPLFGADLSHLLKLPFRKRRFFEPHICLEPDLLDSFTKLYQITFKNPEAGLIAAECGHAALIQTETDLYVIVSICPAYVWDQQGKSNYLTYLIAYFNSVDIRRPQFSVEECGGKHS